MASQNAILKVVRGRPTKLDPKVEEAILAALRIGSTRTAAAEAAGVHRSTFFAWLASGRRGEQPFSDFHDAVRGAEAEAELKAITSIRSAFEKGTWQAAAFWLERRRRQAWGKDAVVARMPTREEALTELRELLRDEPALAADLQLLRKVGT